MACWSFQKTVCASRVVFLLSDPWLFFSFCDLIGEVEVKKQISCSLQLTNKSDDYVAFKVVDLGFFGPFFPFCVLHFVEP